ncbi:MAG TPA: sugar phosphate nucleotidyltransferase [Terracidiphilus sp.]|nr:sugar phosphate nucleotidyltransferase [Terracidiphilus sp.]
MANLTLLVLAAGMGSRYGGLKQIDPVGPCGETIMDYSIFDARRAGFKKVIFVIRKEIEQQFKEIIGSRYEKRIAVDYVFQELGKLLPGFVLPPGRTKPWGTTHAILMAAGAIHEPFAVINADDFYGADGYRALARQLNSESSDFAMVAYILRNTLSEFGSVARGVCRVDESGYLLDIVEMKCIERDKAHARNIDENGNETKLSGDEVVSMNMWGFTPKVFDQLHKRFRIFLQKHGSELKAECYVPTAVNELIAEEQVRVRVLRTSDSWFGVTYREDRLHAIESVRRLIEGGYYPKSLWS